MAYVEKCGRCNKQGWVWEKKRGKPNNRLIPCPRCNGYKSTGGQVPKPNS